MIWKLELTDKTLTEQLICPRKEENMKKVEGKIKNSTTETEYVKN